MRVFIGGVMQASNSTRDLWDQGYRTQIAAAVRERWPEADIIDPLLLHPQSVDYGDAAAKETLFAMAELAGASDVVIAYLPTASMGTALEMWCAYQNGVPVLAITPMAENWVVRALARRVFQDLDSFFEHVRSAPALA